MLKSLRNLFMAIVAVCCFVSFTSITEAASIALLPLVTNVERAEDAREYYYTNAVQCIKNAEGYSLVDNDELAVVVDKNIGDNLLPNAEQMKNIANQAGVDIVVATALDVLGSRETYALDNDTITLDLQGYCYSYNALTGKFTKHRIFDDLKVDIAYTARKDFEMEAWGRNVKREINKVLGVKKIRVEKPRLGW